MKRLFGTAGIRGRTNTEITPQLAMRIAVAYGDLLSGERNRKCEVAVGHDTRHGAAMLAHAAATGFASAGCNVHTYGCVPTGVFSLNIVEKGHDGGILITGSHMPPDRIGILAVLDDGACAPFSVTDRVEEHYRAMETRERTVPPAEIGHILNALHPFEDYVSDAVRKISPRIIKPRRFRVFLDPANGAASYVAKQYFEWFGCDTDLINFAPGPLPGRPSEPRAGTVGEARRRMKESRFDLGLCFDVDADRVLFLTAEGEPVSEDTIGAIFAREELKKGDVCVVPINSSGLIERVCREIGARLEFCPPGQPPTLEAVKRLGAVYSYEESGKYYFTRRQMWADGLFAGARMLEIMATRDATLAELVAGFPQFHQVKHTVPVEDAKKDPVLRAVEALLADRLTEGRTRDVTVDGFKRCYDDDSWLLVRASGTEPLIRVYSDGPTAAIAERRVREGEDLLREAIADIG